MSYLNVMIAYSRLGSKVWRSVANFELMPPAEVKKEEIGYLDYQVIQWQKSIPVELQLPTANAPQTSSRAVQRLQILLYLRANQMRILIYRPVLHSANSIMEKLGYAQTVVDLAKDTIRALSHLNQTSDIYRTQQVCFNYFLVSALAVIFLASCHAPVQFSAQIRDEFYMALDLIKGFSSKSFVSKRLWKTIKSLKDVGPKVGLLNESGSDEDPHSSAALAMAGLAGHEISSLNNFGMNGGAPGQTQAHPPSAQQPQHGNDRVRSASGDVSNSPMNGFQMSYEMTNLFEAALGSASAISGSAHGFGNGLSDGQAAEAIGGQGAAQGYAGGDEELYKTMRDLF